MLLVDDVVVDEVVVDDVVVVVDEACVVFCDDVADSIVSNRCDAAACANIAWRAVGGPLRYSNKTRYMVSKAVYL